jgi:hypothetical protein
MNFYSMLARDALTDRHRGRRGRLALASVPEMDRRAAIPLVAAATFLAGFGAAELTGVRAIGGLVLLAGGIWCGRASLSLVGPRRTIVLLAIAAALFVVSHPLGEAIGPWPAVAASAALAAGAAVLLLAEHRVTV